MSKQYVQHISGQGEKWEVKSKTCARFTVSAGETGSFDLPASEYRLCEPPERWVDVTEQCMEGAQGIVTVFLKNEYRGLEAARGYRLRKIAFYKSPDDPKHYQGFIVEKLED